MADDLKTGPDETKAGSIDYKTGETRASVSVDPNEANKEGVLTGSIDPVYAKKAQVLNDAIQDIGMGWYQWQLFVVVGFGWAQDNMWPIVTSLILPSVALEFHQNRPPLLSLAQNIGLLAGAAFWGFGCDLFGRRWAFNLTIGITAVWGLIAAGAPNFVALGCFAAFWSFGVGGNLPVDSAIFLEALPAQQQYLLTVLSIFWAFAQLLATLIAWPLLGYHTCQEKATICTKSQNFGWRWFMIAMGLVAMIMFALRFFAFKLYESPKYLMGKGREDEAVANVHKIATVNKKTSSLTVEDLTVFNDPNVNQGTDARAILKRRLEKINLEHVRALFRTGRLAFSSTIIISVWALIGLAFPLYNAFIPYITATRGAASGDSSTYITYRNQVIIAVLGVPGAIAGKLRKRYTKSIAMLTQRIGGILVETPFVGRKGALSLSTALTGVWLFCSTTASTSNALLGWNCAYNFTANIMYAVLYAYTPEVRHTICPLSNFNWQLRPPTSF